MTGSVNKSLVVHAVLCVAALAFAWQQGHKEEEKKGGPSSTVLADAKEGDVERVEYTWPKGKTTVESRGSGDERVALMTVSRELPAKAKDKKKDDKKADDKKADDKKDAHDITRVVDADAGVAATEEPAPPPEREEAKFLAGKSVLGALASFEPWKTKRTLGELPADRLKGMGLDAPERSLTVTFRGGKSVTLEIGESSYGGQGRYVRVKGQNVVHLLEPNVVTAFEGGADTLMEKRLVVPEPERIVSAEVKRGDRAWSLLHADRNQPTKRAFVDKADPTSKKDEINALVKAVRDARGQKLAGDELAGSVAMTFAFEIEGRDKPLVVEIVERVDGAGLLARVSDGRTPPWLYELSESQSKELVGAADALSP